MYNVLLHKDMPFGGHDVAAPHLVGNLPPPQKKSSIRAMNRHFLAKLVKYQHLHIIETTASILTTF